MPRIKNQNCHHCEGRVYASVIKGKEIRKKNRNPYSSMFQTSFSLTMNAEVYLIMQKYVDIPYIFKSCSIKPQHFKVMRKVKGSKDFI